MLHMDLFRRASSALTMVRKRFSSRALILAYHRIVDAERDPWSMCVSPENFRQHLAILRRQFKPIPLHELSRRHRQSDIPHRAVVLTFDDGYADNLEIATPILERFEIPATVFVTTGQIGVDGEFWWDELDRALLGPEVLPATLSLVLNGNAQTWRLEAARTYSAAERQRDRACRAWEAAPGSRLHFYYSVWDRLRRVPPAQRRSLLDEILDWTGAGFAPRSGSRALNLQELKTLGGHPLIEVGAHTVSHLFLPEYSVADQRAEINDSKRYLENLFGTPIHSFAYPHGELTEETVELVSSAGFRIACGLTDQAVWKSSEHLRLPRCSVENWDRSQFEQRVSAWLAG